MFGDVCVWVEGGMRSIRRILPSRGRSNMKIGPILTFNPHGIGYLGTYTTKVWSLANTEGEEQFRWLALNVSKPDT